MNDANDINGDAGLRQNIGYPKEWEDRTPEKYFAAIGMTGFEQFSEYFPHTPDESEVRTFLSTLHNAGMLKCPISIDKAAEGCIKYLVKGISPARLDRHSGNA